jgi:Periplasmic component of the Tol biopolymer transport system
MSAPEDKPPEPPSAKPYKYVPRRSVEAFSRARRRRWLILGGTAVLIPGILIAAFFLYPRQPKTKSSVPLAPPPLPVTQWTHDPGLSITPGFSHDGKMVAYASDREGPGNLAIWLQPYPSGQPRRLTKEEFHATDPDFSPDDRQIVYHSERDGGGIYIIPASGGEPRLLAKDGMRPRFSPSGKWIAYYVIAAGPQASHFGAGRVYIVSPEGGAPRQILPDFDLARYPLWLTGEELLIEGRTEQGASDWWVTSVNGGKPIRTFAFERLTHIGAHAAPERWDRGKVLFTATDQLNLHLWELALDPAGWQASGAPRQLSSTDGADQTSAVAPDGRVLFSSMRVTMDIWSVPLDKGRARAGGGLQRVTDDHALNRTPAVGAGATRMIYISDKTGAADLWANNLKTGASWAASSFHIVGHRPVLSPDEARAAYRTNVDGQCVVVLEDLDQGSRRNLNSGCFDVWDWSPDGASLLIYDLSEAAVSAQLWRIDSGQRQPLLSRPGFSLFDAGFSPDGKWIAFSAGRTIGSSEVFIAPFRGAAIKESEWIPISRGGGSLTAWSPDGGTLYYHSQRDGFHCIWAQPLDRAKRPVEDPYAVQHLHAVSLGMYLIKPNDFHMSATPDRLIFNLAQETANLWITGKRE